VKRARPPPRAPAAELVARLEALGHEVVPCPLVETEPLGDAPVDVEGYDWVIVTSRTGAEELRRRMRGSPRRVAAIGRGTAEALGGADLVPAVSTQEGLLEALPRPAGRVLFAGAEDARPLLADALGADVVALYRTRRLRPVDFPSEADVVVLASASAAEAYGALGLRVPAISIGPQTTAAARAGGVRILAEAPTHDVDGLVEALRAWSSPS
jgi:uroporphyrinogen-III synthase